jgi:hypothetical protein
VIDPDLAADRAVHLCQQRRRHVRERDTAQEGGGGEAGGVADDTATHGDDRAPAIRAGANERFVDARDRLQRLEPLAIGDQDRLAPAQRALDLRAMEAPDGRAGDDESPRADLVGVKQPLHPVEDPFADPDRRWVRSGGDVDANRSLGSGGGRAHRQSGIGGYGGHGAHGGHGSTRSNGGTETNGALPAVPAIPFRSSILHLRASSVPPLLRVISLGFLRQLRRLHSRIDRIAP